MSANIQHHNVTGNVSSVELFTTDYYYYFMVYLINIQINSIGG